MKKSILLGLLMCLLCICVKNANAVVIYTWTGTAGTLKWEDAGNWSNNGGLSSSYPGKSATTDEAVVNASVNITLNTAINTIHALTVGTGSGRVVGIAFGSTIPSLQFADITTPASVSTITISAGCTLNFTGAGSVAGTSAISTLGSSTLTTTANVPLTAASISVQQAATITLAGVLTLSGQFQTTTFGVCNLTTSATGNTIGGGVNAHSQGTLNWYGGTTGTTTCSGASQVYVNGTAPATLTIESGNTVTFTANITVDAIANGVGLLVNNGTLNMVNASITTQSPGIAGYTPITNNNLLTLTGASAGIGLVAYCNLLNTGKLLTLPTGSPAVYPTTPFILTNPASITNSSPGLISITGGTVSGVTSGKITLGNGSTITNNAGATFRFIGAALTGTAGSAINNSGIMNQVASTTMSLSGNPASFNNLYTGSLIDTASTITMGAGSSITNTGGTVSLSGGAINCSGNPTTITNQNYTAVTPNYTGTFSTAGTTIGFTGVDRIINSGIFTMNGGTTLTASGSPNETAFIRNTGTFFAGSAANSYCTISLGGKTDKLSNLGTFILGSTSEIVLAATGTNQQVADSSGVFTLMSDGYGSATMVNNSPTVASAATATGFTGNFNVQRYLTGGPSANYRSYRLLTSPVTTSGLIDFSTLNASATVNGTTYYGAFTGGSGSGFTYHTPNSTIYLYNESLDPTAASRNRAFTAGKNVAITNIAATTLTLLSTVNGVTSTPTATVPPGNGFILYYIGSTNNGLTSGTLASSAPPDFATITNIGALNQQNVTTKLWFNQNGKLSDASTLPTNFPGYCMVGNPYPATINLQQLYTDNYNATTNPISSNFYELNDKNPSQAYVVYSATGGNSGSIYSQYVASGQGFFTVATSSTQTLVFKEDQKVYNTTNFSQFSSTSTPPMLLSVSNPKTVNDMSVVGSANKSFAVIQPADTLSGLHMMLQQDEEINDECGIYFSKNCKDTRDIYDAYDLDGVGATVFMSSYTTDGARVALNKMGDYTKGKRVKLYVAAQTDGKYNLKMSDILNIDTTLYNVFLIDKQQNDSLDLVRYKAYAFNFTAADTGAFANRFVLAIEQKQLPKYALVNFTGQKVNAGVQLKWTVVNESNYTGFTLQKQGAANTFSTIYSIQSDSASAYGFIDQNPLTGNNTYRLQQNDAYGNISYSAPVTIGYSNVSSSGLFTIYPNPAKDIITVSLNSTSTITTNYTADIYNTSGILIDHRALNSNVWTQDVTAYKKGMYIMQLKNNNGDVLAKSKFIKY